MYVDYDDVVLREVYAGAGLRVWEGETGGVLLPGRDLIDADDLGLVLYWDRRLEFLTVEAWFGEIGEPRKEAGSFRPGPGPATELLASFGVPQDDGLSSLNTLCRAIRRPAEPQGRARPSIGLRVTLDTDHDRFDRFVEAICRRRDTEGPDARTASGSSGPAADLKISVHAVGRDRGAEGGVATADGRIVVALRPCERLPDYGGFAALDLGNTGSVLAALPVGAFRTDDVRLLHVPAEGRPELRAEAEAVPSRVELTAVREPLDAGPTAARWRIGAGESLVRHGAAGAREPIDGLKRRLADEDSEGPISVKADRLIPAADGVPERRQADQRIALPRRLPAELYACRMLQLFCRAERRRPARLAVTYPTTYSRREVKQLLDVAQRGWLRMAREPHGDETLRRIVERLGQPREAAEAEGGVRMPIDEASAAAFYFVYREIDGEPGGLTRFRYLYPDGMNLLLYDCGGGTTDIALVQAKADEDRAEGLAITVRGRTGMRDFGGDTVTVALFRILKARFAEAVQPSAGGTGALKVPRAAPEADAAPGGSDVDDSGRELDTWLRRHADAIDRLVPTQFDREMHDGVSDRNRRHVRLLLRLADEAKIGLSRKPDDPAVKLADLFGGTFTMANWLTPLVEFLVPAGKHAAELWSRLGEIRIDRASVDALIRVDVAESVEKCNRLIDLRLSGRPDAGPGATTLPEEVHKVVVVGNASRYPLIGRTIAQRLRVPFLEERMERNLAPGDLKHAVAKGAALALMTQTVGLADIRFDSRLYDRLPYDLYCRDLTGHEQVLFKEHVLYSNLGTARLHDVAGAARGGPDGAGGMPDVAVYRRWPGDATDERGNLSRPGRSGKRSHDQYLRFVFEGGPSEPLEMTYDADVARFQMRELSGERRERWGQEVGTPDLYLSPAQRGDL